MDGMRSVEMMPRVCRSKVTAAIWTSPPAMSWTPCPSQSPPQPPVPPSAVPLPAQSQRRAFCRRQPAEQATEGGDGAGYRSGGAHRRGRWVWLGLLACVIRAGWQFRCLATWVLRTTRASRANSRSRWRVASAAGTTGC